MINEAQKIYQFGPYRLDVPERILLKEGQTVALTPKVFDLLALLIANHGHLMEKEVLLKALWPDSFVEEANLNVNVSALRRAGVNPLPIHDSSRPCPGGDIDLSLKLRKLRTIQAPRPPLAKKQTS